MALPMAGHGGASPHLSRNKLHSLKQHIVQPYYRFLLNLCPLPRLLWRPSHAAAELLEKGGSNMGISEHQRVGYQTSHDAGLWYCRECDGDMEHWQEWLCGSEYAELPDSEKNHWRLWEPDMSPSSPVRNVLRHWRGEAAYLIGLAILAILLYGLLWLVV